MKRNPIGQRFNDLHKSIAIIVPKEFPFGGAEVKRTLDSFFQFLVDAGMQHNMEQYEDWEKVKAILGGWE